MLQEAGAQGGDDDDEAAAELLNLANEDWQLRLEEAVHEAKRKMRAQMCAQVEEVPFPSRRMLHGCFLASGRHSVAVALVYCLCVVW